MSASDRQTPCEPELVDTQDLKWQADVKLGPDKEAAWRHPMEKDGWTHAHNAIRSEMSRFRQALSSLAERKCLRQWEIDCLVAAWGEHQAHVHAHHSNEDKELGPFLQQRILSPEKLHDDHASLLRTLADLEERVMGLRAGSWEPVAALHEAWVAYEAAMLPHLREEELTQLPLMRAYFSPEEIGPIVQKIIARGPPCEMGSFICTMGDEAFFEFMKQEGIPGFVWYLEFKSKRDSFRSLFIDNLTAVSEGSPPQRGGLLSCCQAPQTMD
jgi:hemerythrin-like domain-containing protein